MFGVIKLKMLYELSIHIYFSHYCVNRNNKLCYFDTIGLTECIFPKIKNTFLTVKISTWRFTFVYMPLSLFGHLKQLNNLAKLEQVSLMLHFLLLIT